jgi:hypothetical protein
MVSEMNPAMIWLVAKNVRGSFQSPVQGPSGRGFVHVVVIENVAAQEVGYLLDEALREES